MAIRYGVQADTQQECARALREMCERLGLVPAMLPRLVTDDRWLARAVPAARSAAGKPAADHTRRGSVPLVRAGPLACGGIRWRRAR